MINCKTYCGKCQECEWLKEYLGKPICACAGVRGSYHGAAIVPRYADIGADSIKPGCLARSIAEVMRARGVDAAVYDPEAFTATFTFGVAEHRVRWFCGVPQRDLSIEDARAVLLRLMRLPESATKDDAVNALDPSLVGIS